MTNDNHLTLFEELKIGLEELINNKEYLKENHLETKLDKQDDSKCNDD